MYQEEENLLIEINRLLIRLMELRGYPNKTMLLPVRIMENNGVDIRIAKTYNVFVEKEDTSVRLIVYKGVLQSIAWMARMVFRGLTRRNMPKEEA